MTMIQQIKYLHFCCFWDSGDRREKWSEIYRTVEGRERV